MPQLGLALALLCAGCNALLGIHDFSQTDAAVDATVIADALPHVLCSPISMLAGKYSTTMGLLYGVNSGNYTIMGDSVMVTGTLTINSINYYDVREGSYMMAISPVGPIASAIDLELSSQTPGNRAGFVIANGTLEIHRMHSGIDSTIATTPYDAMTQRYLRFRVSAGQITYETSSDGSTFAVQATTDADALTFVQVLAAFTGMATTTLPSIDGTPTGDACPIGELADDFSMGLDKWGTNVASGGTITIVDDALVLTMSTDNAQDVMLLMASTVYDLSNAALTLEIPQMLAPSPNTAFAIVAQSRYAKDAVELGAKNGTVEAVLLRNATMMTISTSPYDPTQMRWWRLHATTNSVAWEVSPDRNTWTQLAEVMMFDGLDNMQIAIEAQGMTTTPSAAIVDNVGGL